MQHASVGYIIYQSRQFLLSWSLTRCFLLLRDSKEIIPNYNAVCRCFVCDFHRLRPPNLILRHPRCFRVRRWRQPRILRFINTWGCTAQIILCTNEKRERNYRSDLAIMPALMSSDWTKCVRRLREYSGLEIHVLSIVDTLLGNNSFNGFCVSNLIWRRHCVVVTESRINFDVQTRSN